MKLELVTNWVGMGTLQKLDSGLWTGPWTGLWTSALALAEMTFACIFLGFTFCGVGRSAGGMNPHEISARSTYAQWRLGVFEGERWRATAHMTVK